MMPSTKLESHCSILHIWELLSSTSNDVNPYSDKTYLFKVINRKTKKKCEICSNLTIKTPERRHGCFYCYLRRHFTPFSSVFIVKFEQVNIGWVAFP